MKKGKVAVLPGDGIGPEIMEAALAVIEAALAEKQSHLAFEKAVVGGAAIDLCDDALPADTLKLCEESDAIFFGSVGGPKWEHLPAARQPERRALLPLRKHFQLFANLRPIVSFPELTASLPLRRELIGTGIDLLVVRELTSGIYFGQPKGRDGSGGQERAYDTMVYHREEIERIAQVAFQAATQRERKVTSVDKANVLTAMLFWRETVSSFAEKFNADSKKRELDHINVELNHIYVDNAAMQLILNPKQFDVLLCPNLFGDILSDEASVLGGSLGILPSASLSSAKENFGLYEPAGGSAPTIAGQNIANPIAQILSGALMLRYSFDADEIAQKIEAAVSKAIKAGARTQDIATPAEQTISTKEMTAEIIRHL